MGYPFGKKGWQRYDLEEHEYFVSRDVIFKENEFPYAKGVSEVSLSPIIAENFEDVFLINETVGIGNRGSINEIRKSAPPVPPSVDPVSHDPAIIEVATRCE